MVKMILFSFFKAHGIDNTENQYKATKNLDQSSRNNLRHACISHLIKS